jgi:hypothetical protein
MEVFAFNPAAGNEPIADFNARLKAYCLTTNVLAVEVSVVDQAIVLSLTTDEDDGGPMSALLITPVVVPLTSSDLLSLETKLTEARDDLLAQDSEDSPFAPFEVRVHSAGGVFYAVFLVNAGTLEEIPEGADPNEVES